MDSSSNFSLYLVGFLIIIGGMAWGAFMAGVPPVWIGVGVVILLGIGILSAIKRTQAKSVPHDSAGTVVQKVD